MAHHKTNKTVSQLTDGEKARLREAWLEGEVSLTNLLKRFHLRYDQGALMTSLFGERADVSLKRSPWKKK